MNGLGILECYTQSIYMNIASTWNTVDADVRSGSQPADSFGACINLMDSDTL